MSPSFLFTALDKSGKNTTERVAAETLSVAKYKLEIQGYSHIEFFESEVSTDVKSLFGEKQLSNANNQTPEHQLALYYKSGWYHTLLEFLKVTLIFWLPMLIWAGYSRQSFPLYALAVFGAITIYFMIPAMIFNYFTIAHLWANNGGVKFWGRIASLFNLISVNKIPKFELDSKIACAEAREGNVNGGLSRIAKYQNDSKTPKRLFNISLGAIYCAAKKYDEVLIIRENSSRESDVSTEELVDYAVALALHHKKTSEAREVVERVMSRELNSFGTLFLPLCQGIIETEDGNFTLAEFYLREMSERLKPFQKNEYLDGLRHLAGTILTIALGNQGKKEEASQTFRAAKPYLIAQKEFELLQRCEEALS